MYGGWLSSCHAQAVNQSQASGGIVTGIGGSILDPAYNRDPGPALPQCWPTSATLAWRSGSARAGAFCFLTRSRSHPWTDGTYQGRMLHQTTPSTFCARLDSNNWFSNPWLLYDAKLIGAFKFNCRAVQSNYRSGGLYMLQLKMTKEPHSTKQSHDTKTKTAKQYLT